MSFRQFKSLVLFSTKQSSSGKGVIDIPTDYSFLFALINFHLFNRHGINTFWIFINIYLLQRIFTMRA